MGLFTIYCPSCKQPHVWFSGSKDQRCSDCKNAAANAAAQEAALKPRAPFVVIDESASLDKEWSNAWNQKPFLQYNPGPFRNPGFVEVNFPRQYADRNKLTEANKESEEPSTYNSATDGRIPLSFKGRHLMQRLRNSTVAAIRFGDWHVFGEAVSRARAAIAERMGKLESELRGAKAQTTAYRLGAVEQLKYITKLEAERYTHCEELHQRIDKLESELRVSKSITNVYINAKKRRDAKIADLESTIKINEDFIKLLSDRLGARLKQLENIRHAVAISDKDARLDP